MSEPKPRVLIAYDGSDLAKGAVRSAAELFPGSPALVVTVWEPALAAAAVSTGMDTAGIVPVPPDPELMAEVAKAGEQHATTVAKDGARIAGALGLDAEPHAIPDEVHVADALVELAVARDAAAIVIGSHGVSGLRSHLLGSTSRDLISRSKLPVVVVQAHESS